MPDTIPNLTGLDARNGPGAVVKATAMKLGLVRRGYSGTGGAEAYLRRFADAARAAGHEVVLFGSPEWEAAAWQGGKVIVPGGNPRAFADMLRKIQPRTRCDFLFSLERVWECDAYRAGDGVHASWLERRGKYEARWKSMLRGINPKHTGLLEIERALFTGGTRCVIANSQMVKDEIITRYGMSAENIHVIRNGVPAWEDEPGLRGRMRTELGVDGCDYVLLFAGTGWVRKGLGFAIKAVNELPGATLLVAGKGRREKMPASDRVRYLGPVSPRNMREMLAAADVFVLPTIYEPFSNACLEALAAGLPVVTTKANGFAEIIEPGVEGEVIAEPGDIAALRDALAAWADPGKREAVRSRLREKGSQYSVEANARRTIEVIEREAGQG